MVVGNCMGFGYLSSRLEHNYTGVVEDSFELKVGGSVRFILSDLWVIYHSFPLF